MLREKRRKLNSFGVILRKLRIQHDISTKEFSESIGVSNAYILSVETVNNGNKLSVSYFNKVIKFLKDKNILTDDLLKQLIISYYRTKGNIVIFCEDLTDETIYEIYEKYLLG